jgi:hypothetical protein
VDEEVASATMSATPNHRRHIVFGIWVAVCLAALCWPGYPLFGNSIEPRILGVPFSLTWVIGWVMASTLGLLIYDRSDRGDEA